QKFHGGFLAVITPLHIKVVQKGHELRCQKMTKDELCQYPANRPSEGIYYPQNKCNWDPVAESNARDSNGRPLPSPLLDNEHEPSNGAAASA
ncbi:hypothetical protein PMAYCL1PPCAC_14159, partial [Pristionchus mayeri]